MPFNFPSSPTVGQQITNSTSSIIYTWNGTAWTSAPITASQAITASYALNAANVTQVTISDNAPALVNYQTGSLWFNSNNLGLYVNYQDADSGQWVGVNAIGPVASASFAQTASFVTTASFAQTASMLTTRPTLEFRRTLTTGLALTNDILVNWNINDTNSITSLSYDGSTGTFTNTTSTTRTYIIDYQSAARLANTGLLINEFNMFIIKGTGTPTPAQTNRIAEYVSQPNNSAYALKRLSTVITLAPNEVFRCFQYITATGATTWIASGNEFGYADNYSTRLKITEI